MIFTNLTLNNIGPYKGKHEFNLKPEVDGVKSKPVILFGGLNGAGKTQILESIKLLGDSSNSFAKNTVDGIEPNIDDIIDSLNNATK